MGGALVVSSLYGVARLHVENLYALRSKRAATRLRDVAARGCEVTAEARKRHVDKRADLRH
jgi:hypothetical protein